MFRSKKFNKDFEIVDEKKRYKLYKSGKNWVKASNSQLDLFRIGGMGEVVSTSLSDTEELDHAHLNANTLAGIGAILAAGAAGFVATQEQTVYADETSEYKETGKAVIASEPQADATTETSSNPIIAQAQAEVKEQAEQDSVSVSESVSQSVSASLSASVSVSASLSASESESASLSASESASTSATASQSAATPVSESASVSEAPSQSASVQASASTPVSESASTSAQPAPSASAQTSASASAPASQSASVSAQPSQSAGVQTSASLVESASAAIESEVQASVSTSTSASLDVKVNPAESLATSKLGDALSSATQLSSQAATTSNNLAAGVVADKNQAQGKDTTKQAEKDQAADKQVTTAPKKGYSGFRQGFPGIIDSEAGVFLTDTPNGQYAKTSNS